MNELSYKDEIEALNNGSDFEKKGDEKYLNHEDDEARLEWAFYRPSGSHPNQVSDRNVYVSIMAFNHSRLSALDRYNILNPEVISNDTLRNKIRNRSRMLFRAMIDDDFNELVLVLSKYPVFFDLAYDQMINGRIWNEIYADPIAASKFLHIADKRVDSRLLKGLQKRLQPLKNFNIEESKAYLDRLCSQVQELHIDIRVHYVKEFRLWIENITLHPLQKIIWHKQINILKE